jgi:hypothetical protein
MAICAVILSLLFWLSDSLIHRFIYSEEAFELIPADVNELWMRALVIVLLLGLGFIADNRAKKIYAAEQEKVDIFVATISATQHVLNNLLNQWQLVFMEMEKSGDVSDETWVLLERSIKEGREQFDKLCSVQTINARTIQESVQPK